MKNRDRGTVTIIYQIVGKTTMLLSEIEEGGYIADVVGPLGPSHLGHRKRRS